MVGVGRIKTRKNFNHAPGVHDQTAGGRVRASACMVVVHQRTYFCIKHGFGALVAKRGGGMVDEGAATRVVEAVDAPAPAPAPRRQQRVQLGPPGIVGGGLDGC